MEQNKSFQYTPEMVAHMAEELALSISIVEKIKSGPIYDFHHNKVLYLQRELAPFVPKEEDSQLQKD